MARAERIESRSNALVKHMRKLGTSRSFRHTTNEFLLDGPKLLEEAYKANARIKKILIEEDKLDAMASKYPWIKELPVSVCAKGIIESASAVESPQGVLFTCEIPRPTPGNNGRIILADNLQDTGNVGTIIRTADAFGIDAVVCDNCADYLNPKTVRATMGAIFRVPVYTTEILPMIQKLREKEIPVYAAVLDEKAKTPFQLDMSRCAVIIGNEGNGVRPELCKACDSSVYIPMSGKAESLNAAIAASIIMWEMTR